MTSHTAIINDSLDKARDNCDWYVHPDYPELLLVITIKEVPVGDQLFIPYGPDYWCSDKYSLDTLAAAVIRYNIDIGASPHWRRLKKYPDLCRFIDKRQHFTKRDITIVKTARRKTSKHSRKHQPTHISTKTTRQTKLHYNLDSNPNIDVTSSISLDIATLTTAELTNMRSTESSPTVISVSYTHLTLPTTPYV